uniref:Transmembrane protein n=1 Tax=Panagrolaimus sp. JU765 TaxID=591449 RepID=A0AC34R4D2_9BILA
MADSNDPVDYTTCCGCHVRGGTSATGSIIYLICGVFLILADKYENPYFYLPYLICSGICLFVMILMCLLFIVFLISDVRSEFKRVVTLSLLIFVTVLFSYFWYVVKRAGEYMEKEICARKIPLSANGYVQAVIVEEI